MTGKVELEVAEVKLELASALSAANRLSLGQAAGA